jgi:hypothetical protein
LVTSSAVFRPRSSIKSEVMASMFTGTSLRACFVRVAESVSLADQPVSRSVETMNGERSTVSSAGAVEARAGAVWAGEAAAVRSRARAVVATWR